MSGLRNAVTGVLGNTIQVPQTIPQTVQAVTLRLTSAQLLALNTTPQQLVQAPGPNLHIQVLSYSYDLEYGTATYADTGSTGLYYGSSSGLAINTTFSTVATQTASDVAYGPVTEAHAAIASFSNQPVVLTGSANMTTGDGTMSVTVTYITVPE